MPIDFKWTPLPLLALLVGGCTALAEPDDRATPPGDGESMGALETEGTPPGGGPWRPPPYPGPSCQAGGRTFPDGTDVPSADSCKRCVCDDGNVLCTALPDPSCVGTDAGIGLGTDAGPGAGEGPGSGEGSGTDAGSGTDTGSCEAAGQSFPDGSDVPSGDDCNTCGCNDGRVTCTERACDPVFCALFIEEPDGVCGRFPLDPCISQDPDCSGAPAATAPELLP